MVVVNNNSVSIKEVGLEVLGTCPASVDLLTGVISVNTDVFNKLTSFQKRFTLLHEIAHFRLQTLDEQAADDYALEKIFETEPYSLKQAVTFLCEVPNITEERLEHIYIRALELDAAKGNETAKQELERIMNRHSRKPKIGYFDGDPEEVNVEEPETIAPAPNPEPEPTDIENEDEPQTPREKRQVVKAGKRFAEMNPGFFLGGSYIRLSDVLLVLQIILLWKLYKRG